MVVASVCVSASIFCCSSSETRCCSRWLRSNIASRRSKERLSLLEDGEGVFDEEVHMGGVPLTLAAYEPGGMLREVIGTHALKRRAAKAEWLGAWLCDGEKLLWRSRVA